jgi:hypothetical protein
MVNRFTNIIFFFCIILLKAEAQEIPGTQIFCSQVIKATSAELMEHWVNQWPIGLKKRNIGLGLEEPNRENLPQAPGALELSQWPISEGISLDSLNELDAPQTLGISFTAATLSDAGAFPPDVMGAAGPTQYVVFVNGRLRTFNKVTGIADGVINADPDAFFSSVLTPPGTNEVSYTSDPNVRYDRLSGRWFLTIIDVTVNTTTGSLKPNRNLFAWSDGPIITGSTLWTFTYFQNTTYFDDYPSLGIDADAIYVGTNRFNAGVGGSLNNLVAYVWNKSSFLSGFPTGYIWTLYDGTTAPLSPRGVDNYDPLNTGTTAVGYFIGVDLVSYGSLVLRRVTNPAGTPPTISANILITVNTTRDPIKVRHSGNSSIPANNGYLDALDDRLFAAHFRNGRLWTAHNIGVRNDGISSTISNSRNACRWYEFTNLNSTPSLVQTGTLYDNSGTATNLNQRNYWIPTIMVSGQGHAALGCSIAGNSEFINGFTTGRLVGDALGTLRDGPGGSSLPGYTTSSTAYNPSSDPGGASGRRWGDYSFTSLDPNDDMTMWTAQEFCDATNSWGVRVVQLLAPPPATPSSSNPNAIAPNQTSVNVAVTGTVVNGSGFFDPGAGFPNHISASLPGGIVVNSITYNSPTQVTLNLNTTGVPNGFYTVTVTNPDGQFVTSATGILQIDSNLPVELSSFTAKVLRTGGIKLDWRTETEVNNYGFEVERLQDYNIEKLQEWERIGFVEGNGNSNSPKDYSFTDLNAKYGSYAYHLKQIDTDGQFEYSKIIEVYAGNIPDGFVLEQNYPNPFNPSTTIKFALAETQQVELKVFDILGNEVAELFNGVADGGKVYEREFSAESFSSGIYFYRLVVDSFGETDSKVENRKMLLLK